MSKSKLTSVTVKAHSGNYSSGRSGYKICKITPHHMAGVLTAEQCGKIFQTPGRYASSNYGIGNDGKIACYVEEENRSYASASKSNDCQAITIEVSNSKTGGDWPISKAAWNSLVNLCVDICRRYNFKLDYTGNSNGSLTRHNMFMATTCPGPYLQNRFQELADTVNKILDGEEKEPEKPTTPTLKHKVGETVKINGVYTASNSTTKLNPLRNSGKITKIIKGARNPYLLDNGNLGWVNDSCIVSETSSNKKTISQLADEVIAGKWGVGEDRKNRLEAAGYDYDAVQDEVNRKLSGSTTIKVGDKVQINKNADKYVTGEGIPDWVKKNKYKVIQVSNKKILLGSIMSWVYASDVHKV